MSLLILGGTNDALRLAGNLHKKGIPIIYSLAGIVRTPSVDFNVITGGFGQYGGLNSYIKAHANALHKNERAIVGIVDATHPYANHISTKAYHAALANDLPYWQFDRPTWQQRPDDNWFEYKNWDDLLPLLKDKQSIFITTGQLDTNTLDSLKEKLLAKTSAKIVLRTAIKPGALEQRHNEKIHWIQAIGPFSLEGETALMQKYGIDVLISKNSGGDATIAKLHAARQLQIPVYLLQRPENPAKHSQDQSDKILKKTHFQTIFSDLNDCEENILQFLSKNISNNINKTK